MWTQAKNYRLRGHAFQDHVGDLGEAFSTACGRSQFLTLEHNLELFERSTACVSEELCRLPPLRAVGACPYRSLQRSAWLAKDIRILWGHLQLSSPLISWLSMIQNQERIHVSLDPSYCAPRIWKEEVTRLTRSAGIAIAGASAS